MCIRQPLRPFRRTTMQKKLGSTKQASMQQGLRMGQAGSSPCQRILHRLPAPPVVLWTQLCLGEAAALQCQVPAHSEQKIDCAAQL